MFVINMCLVTIYKLWTLVTLDFIMGNIGRRFDSEMGIRNKDRSNLFPMNCRILIYNLLVASMRISWMHNSPRNN